MPILGFQLYTIQSELVIGNGKLIEKEMYKYLHVILGKLDRLFLLVIFKLCIVPYFL